MTVDEAFWLRVLGRDRIAYDAEAARPLIDGEAVLITGAGGTIGQTLVIACLELGARRVIALDQSEYALYQLKGLSDTGRVRTVLGSVLDVDFLDRLLGHEPAVILHAAAVKHVGFAEQQPAIAARVNVGGALNVTTAACEAHFVKRAILISTDKAAAPTTIMGMTKRVAESAWGSWGKRGVIVRPVNVIGSSGSVGETFVNRLQAGSPLKVARAARRMFSTAAETAAMILEAAGIDRAGGLVAYPSPPPAETEMGDLAMRIAAETGELAPQLITVEPWHTEKAREVLTDHEDGLANQVSPRIAAVASFSDRRIVADVWRAAEAGNDRVVREVLTRKFSNQEARVG